VAARHKAGHDEILFGCKLLPMKISTWNINGI